MVGSTVERNHSPNDLDVKEGERKESGSCYSLQRLLRSLIKFHFLRVPSAANSATLRRPSLGEDTEEATNQMWWVAQASNVST